MKCPRCKNALLQKSEQGGTKVRTKGPLVFAKDGVCTTQCFWCGESVKIPLELRKAAEKFVLRPNKTA